MHIRLAGVITGSQLHRVALTNIFLGSFTQRTMALMNFFGGHLSSTPWFGTLTSYYNLANSGANPVSVSHDAELGGNLTLSISDIQQTLAAVNFSR